MEQSADSALTERLDRLANRLREAEAAEDTVVDLTGLDTEIAAICAEVKRLGPAAGDEIRDRLGLVLEALDSLKSGMATEYARLSQAMGGLNVRKRAVAAYGKANRKP